MEWKPAFHVLRIPTVLLEAETAVVAHENVDAVVAGGTIEGRNDSSSHGASPGTFHAEVAGTRLGQSIRIESTGDKKDRACANDALPLCSDVTVRKRKLATLLLYVDMSFKPVIYARSSSEIERQICRDEVCGRRGRKRHRIAERHVGDRRQDTAVHSPLRVAVFCQRSETERGASRCAVC